MPDSHATRELLASPAEVWAFLAEPRHLADWWPSIAAVEPDRHGLATGARWVIRSRRTTLLRRAGVEETLVVTAAEEPRRMAFEFVRGKVRAELVLEPAPGGTAVAELTVLGPAFGGPPRRLAETALEQLHALCQTGASL